MVIGQASRRRREELIKDGTKFVNDRSEVSENFNRRRVARINFGSSSKECIEGAYLSTTHREMAMKEEAFSIEITGESRSAIAYQQRKKRTDEEERVNLCAFRNTSDHKKEDKASEKVKPFTTRAGESGEIYPTVL